MTEYFILFLIFIICYLIGSIPFGLILTKLFDNNDLRNIGSGNIGATNVLRTGNKTLALLTLILDLSKSFIPLFIFFKLYPHPIINDFFNLIIVDKIFLILVFGYFFVLGHCFPIWLKFKGGKGIATSLGVILSIDFFIGLCLLTIWILVFLIFKISSLSALISSTSFPILIFFKYEKVNLLYLSILLTIFVFFTHRANIIRLLKKEEKKI
jgi:glycerol-3-phosphate acyltransferase PlsY|tara:strand:+ start:196 stop:828 length:633 start_codon:yes stop_codon:yes gene_type:complete